MTWPKLYTILLSIEEMKTLTRALNRLLGVSDEKQNLKYEEQVEAAKLRDILAKLEQQLADKA